MMDLCLKRFTGCEKGIAHPLYGWMCILDQSTQGTNTVSKEPSPGRFVPLLHSFHNIGHRWPTIVLTPALLNERLHLYSVSSGIRLTFRHVVRESGPQSVNNTSVELRVSQRRNGNHLHILIREITGITVTDNTGKDFRHDTSKRKHVHLIVRLRST